MGTMRVPLKQEQTAKNELFSKLEGSFRKHDFYKLNSCRRMFFSLWKHWKYFAQNFDNVPALQQDASGSRNISSVKLGQARFGMA